MIELKHITKRFEGTNQIIEAVNDVSLTVQKKEIFGVIGYSGAGKSTLIRCINLLERPNEGSVELNGTDLTSLKPKELREARKKIGMIFQHFHLLQSRTVAQNIEFPLKGSKLSKKEKQEKVRELLHLVGLEDKINAYPSQLSGGQKQRVAIARALANDPAVLLCDEATSALDPQTTHSILQLLKELNKKLGLTIVLITHEMSVIKEICHKVAVMENGRVIESGTVVEVFTNPTHQVTKEFVQSTTNLNKIQELIEQKSAIVSLKENEQLLQLRYGESNTDEPLISLISQKFKVDVNIIFGTIEIIEEKPIGWLVVILKGSKEAANEAIHYLQQNNVQVEVLETC